MEHTGGVVKASIHRAKMVAIDLENIPMKETFDTQMQSPRPHLRRDRVTYSHLWPQQIRGEKGNDPNKFVDQMKKRKWRAW
jgi:hypothetical protein